MNRVGTERIILARCESEQALEIGRSLGISLYQGRWLDRMLSRTVSREQTVLALSDALARHRAALR